MRASPEGKAMMHAFDVLKHLLAAVYKLRRAMSGLENQSYLAAWNKWVHNIEERAARRERMHMTLVRMSPDGRAMLKAIERFQTHQKAQHAMHRAPNLF